MERKGGGGVNEKKSIDEENIGNTYLTLAVLESAR